VYYLPVIGDSLFGNMFGLRLLGAISRNTPAR
jgi:hypothetical protein